MIGSLFLSPQSPQDCCDLDTLEQALAPLAVCGEPSRRGDACRIFLAGENFARHVVFAGCSPYLRFEPRDEADRHFCHVALHGPFELARVLTGENTVKPRCPHCRARIPDWSERIDSGKWQCESCNGELEASTLQWRQNAAVGRCFVELRNVFPGEASPSDQLLGSLSQASGFAWRHAWAGLLDTC